MATLDQEIKQTTTELENAIAAQRAAPPPPVAAVPAPGTALPSGPETAEEPTEAEKAAAELAKKLRRKNDKYLKLVGRWTITIVAAGGAFAVWAAARTCVTTDGKTACRSWGRLANLGDWDRWTPARRSFIVTTVVVVVLLLALSVLLARSGGIRALLIGKDGRFSTSATQVALWTLALVFTILFLSLQRSFGLKEGAFDETFKELDIEYLLLLGGPYAAAGIARAAMSRKTEEGTVQKVEASTTRPTDILTSDDGTLDLVDLQFLAFNVAALVYFISVFNQTPTELPAIPAGLVGLTSVAALTYTGNKLAAQNAPAITSVTRRDGDGPIRPGERVLVVGANLVPSGANELEQLPMIRIKFGKREVVALPRANAADPSRELEARVPVDATPPGCDVIVVTAADAESNSYRLELVADTAVITGAAPVPIEPGKPFVVTGRFFRKVGSETGVATVWFGDVPRLATETTDSALKIEDAPLLTAGTTTAVKVWAAGATAPSEIVTLPVA